MKVLFCTDGSVISYNALKNFSKLFSFVEADIMCVSDMTYIPDNVLMNADKYIQQCAMNVHSILEFTKHKLNDFDIQVNDLYQKCGNAVDNILNIESQNNYDFIVMGSNGKKGLQKWLGSVSQEVASNSRTSIYISKSCQEHKNILFPVTYNDISRELLKSIINKMNFTDANIHILNAYEIPDFLFLEGNIDSNWICDIELKQQKEAKKILNSLEMIFVDKGIYVANKEIVKGNPSEQILKYIKNYSVSHVVLNMRKRKRTFLSTSISRRILENAPCDVLIYKEN